MDPNQQKEQFSHAFTRAVAAVAGVAVEEPSVDDDSVDLSFRGDSSFGARRPHLDVQLKCTERLDGQGAEQSFFLKKKNYDDLRLLEEELTIPRILVVVRVPEDVGDWLHATDEELALRHCGYWVSLRGAEERPENETGVTVTLYAAQTLNADALGEIMRNIAGGNWP
jgi:hypothetical protein